MSWRDTQSFRLRRTFLEGFSAMDIAEPLVSFDIEADARTVQQFMFEKDFNLVDCLQLGDKGWILTYDEEMRKALGQGSRTKARRAVKKLESLRNNLAHTQEIIPTG